MGAFWAHAKADQPGENYAHIDLKSIYNAQRIASANQASEIVLWQIHNDIVIRWRKARLVRPYPSRLPWRHGGVQQGIAPPISGEKQGQAAVALAG